MAARVTLTLGKEQYLSGRAISAVVEAARAQDPEVQRVVIEASEEDAAHRLREATAPTLFGDGAVVVVEGIDAAEDPMAAALKEVLVDLPDGVWLVLTHPGGVKGKALVESVKGAGAEVVACAEVRGRGFQDFVTREFAARRRPVTGPAVDVICAAVGADLGLLAAAVSQLCADVEAKTIDVPDVHAYLGGVADVPGFAVADAVWDRRQGDALRMLRQLMLTGSGRAGPYVVASMAAGLRGLVRVGAMPPGTPEDTVAREAGVPPFKVKHVRRQWSNWSGDQRRLAMAAVAIADADAAMKGGVGEGTALDEEQKALALEILVGRLSRPAGT